jgi:hypothetical protein
MFVSPSAANARTSSLRQADEFCVTIAHGQSRIILISFATLESEVPHIESGLT